MPSGVFPTVDPRAAGPELSSLLELAARWPSDQQRAKDAVTDHNYNSYDENIEDAEKELQKEFDQGFFHWYPSARDAEAAHGPVTLSRIGAIVTQKPEGEESAVDTRPSSIPCQRTGDDGGAACVAAHLRRRR